MSSQNYVKRGRKSKGLCNFENGKGEKMKRFCYHIECPRRGNVITRFYVDCLHPAVHFGVCKGVEYNAPASEKDCNQVAAPDTLPPPSDGGSSGV